VLGINATRSSDSIFCRRAHKSPARPHFITFLKKHPQIALPDRQEMHFFDDEEIFSPGRSRIVAPTFPPSQDRPRRRSHADYLYWKPAMERFGIITDESNSLSCCEIRSIARSHTGTCSASRTREPLGFLDALKEEPRRIAQPLTIESRRFAYVDRGFYSATRPGLQIFSARTSAHRKVRRFSRSKAGKRWTAFSNFLGVKSLRRICDKIEICSVRAHDDAGERKYLSEVFSAEITKLEQMLGWDCSDWKGSAVDSFASRSLTLSGFPVHVVQLPPAHSPNARGRLRSIAPTCLLKRGL